MRKSPASVSLSKLDFLNKCHLSHQLEDPSRLSDYITGFRDAILKDYRDPVTKRILPCVRIDKLNDDEFLSKVLVSVKDKAGKTDILHRLAAPYVVFLPDYPRLDAELVGALSGPNVGMPFPVKKNLQIALTIQSEKIVKTFLLKLHQADETTWTPASAKDLAHQVSVNLNLKFGVVAKVLRPILTGSVVGADLGSMLVLLGKQELQQRIEHFLEWRAQSNDQ